MRCRLIAVLCALPLGLLCVSGCLIPYAYPNLAYVPGPEFVLPDSHAFRVDVTVHEADAGEDGEFTLTEIPTALEEIPDQFGFSINRGYYVLGLAANYNVGWFHSTRIRVYTPGYPLIEVAPWDMSSKGVDASRASLGWSGQEQAIDDLIRCPAVCHSRLALQQHQGAEESRGIASPRDIRASPETFAFAAKEYERVATLAPKQAEAARLRKKAEDLRKVLAEPNSP